MTRKEINKRKIAIAIFDGYEVIGEHTLKKDEYEIDIGRFVYDTSFDDLIPIGKKIIFGIGDSLHGVEELGIFQPLETWFTVISDFCIDWCKKNNKPL